MVRLVRRVVRLLGVLAAIGARRGATLGQVALRRILERPGVAAAIVGATSTRHLATRLGVLDLALDADDLAAIEPVTGRRSGPSGDRFDVERDKDGRHGRIMRYNECRARDRWRR
jgi:aryl-alcohol dehydrogenase-like predicted oxidoreductase